MGLEKRSRFRDWQSQILPGPAVTLQFSAFSFDVFFQEVFSTLTAGGTLVCLPREQLLEPDTVLEKIAEHKVNRLFLPYVALKQLVDVLVDVAVAVGGIDVGVLVDGTGVLVGVAVSVAVAVAVAVLVAVGGTGVAVFVAVAVGGMDERLYDVVFYQSHRYRSDHFPARVSGTFR